MNIPVSRIVRFLITTLIMLAIIFGLASLAFNAGFAQGVLQSGTWSPAERGPYAYHPGFGFGFGPLACIIPFLFLFFSFAVLRMVVFGRHMRHHHMGHHKHDAEHAQEHDHDHPSGLPAYLESHLADWHRRAHETPPPTAEPR